MPVLLIAFLFDHQIVRIAAQGIPEPDLVMYGTVRNVRSNANIRLGYGTMTWLFQPIGGGSPITVSTILTNINDQFSYVLRVACATEVPGYPSSPNTVRLSPSAITYNRSQVNWNGNVLSFVQPSQINTTFTSTDRGRIERVDLDVSLPILDLDANGLPDDWERLYFGRTGIDPLADSDGDFHKNLDEYRLNTNPTDSGSGLRITEITAVQGGIRLKWSSAHDRFYALQRSLIPTGPFGDISTGIAATPATNTVLDTSGTVGNVYFYRLRLDDGSTSVPALLGDLDATAMVGVKADGRNVLQQ